ncbi:MAG: hypothetical protein WA724_03485 [Candidatus Dormiibacterota bacterium]
MSHTGALYTVRVRGRKKDDYRRLGGINRKGTALIDELNTYLQGAVFQSASGPRSVNCSKATIAGAELQVELLHRGAGVVSDLDDAPDHIVFHRQLTHSERLRCAALFALPRAQETGWLAIHSNNRTSTIGLLRDGLRSKLWQAHNLHLEIDSAIEESVFRAAVENGLVETVILERLERPSDRARATLDEWVPSGHKKKIRVGISSPGGGGLRTNPLERLFRGEPTARDAILTFEGVPYESAKVVVQLRGGGQRTFNIDRPDAGLPISEDLNVSDGTGGPEFDDLFAALRQMIPDTSSEG